VADKAIKILLIEDNVDYAQLVRAMLFKARSTRFEIEWQDSLLKGLERLTTGDIDLVLLDLNLPDSSGLDSFVSINAQVPNIPIVVLTGSDDEELALNAVQIGAQDYLIKEQVNSDYLIRSIRYAIERKLTEEALRRARDELEKGVYERTVELLEANELLKKEVLEQRTICLCPSNSKTEL